MKSFLAFMLGAFVGYAAYNSGWLRVVCMAVDGVAR
jgi:hypothetical protein